jgi:hypothetical protein
MALLEQVEYSPGEAIQNFYDKFNAVVDALNLLSASNVIGIKLLEIGAWNMTGSFVDVAHGLADYTKVIPLKAVVFRDAADYAFDLTSVDSATGNVSGSITQITDTNIRLVRTDGGIFDNTDFNGASGNRGLLLVAYIK